VCNIEQTATLECEYIPRMTHSVTLLRAYVRRRGLFARVAKRLGLDPSYVSRVASGERHSRRITLALDADLNKMQADPLRSEPHSDNLATSIGRRSAEKT
jgi:hypothetical protein